MSFCLPPRSQIAALAECRSVDEYERLNRVSEGTYGVVFRARDKKTGRICALKKVRSPGGAEADRW